MTALKLTAEEAGAMDFPVVIELLQYWSDFPPEHVLLRAMAGYEPSKKDGRKKRQRRAETLGDTAYNPEQQPQPQPQQPEEKETSLNADLIPGTRRARHSTAGPGHIQEAIERFKKQQQWEVPK